MTDVSGVVLVLNFESCEDVDEGMIQNVEEVVVSEPVSFGVVIVALRVCVRVCVNGQVMTSGVHVTHPQRTFNLSRLAISTSPLNIILALTLFCIHTLTLIPTPQLYPRP